MIIDPKNVPSLPPTPDVSHVPVAPPATGELGHESFSALLKRGESRKVHSSPAKPSASPEKKDASPASKSASPTDTTKDRATADAVEQPVDPPDSAAAVVPSEPEQDGATEPTEPAADAAAIAAASAVIASTINLRVEPPIEVAWMPYEEDAVVPVLPTDSLDPSSTIEPVPTQAVDAIVAATEVSPVLPVEPVTVEEATTAVTTPTDSLPDTSSDEAAQPIVEAAAPAPGVVEASQQEPVEAPSPKPDRGTISKEKAKRGETADIVTTAVDPEKHAEPETKAAAADSPKPDVEPEKLEPKKREDEEAVSPAGSEHTVAIAELSTRGEPQRSDDKHEIKDAPPTSAAPPPTDALSPGAPQPTTNIPQLTPDVPQGRLPPGLAGRATSEHEAVRRMDVDATRFLKRVVGAFQAAEEHGGDVRLKLRPPELGALRLEIAVRDGLVTARMETETPAARTLLLDNLGQLRERLAEQGLRIEKFEVNVSDRQSNGMPDPRPQQQAQQPPARSFAGRPTVGEEPLPRLPRGGTDATGLNVLV